MLRRKRAKLWTSRKPYMLVLAGKMAEKKMTEVSEKV
jgi:hypothetical protein